MMRTRSRDAIEPFCPTTLEDYLALTYDPDPRVRKAAVHELCPCNLKANYEQVWDRLIAMTEDEDVGVRSQVFHTLGDGSPREREQEVVSVLEKMHNDPDPMLRRHVRQLLAHYRHGGRLNIL